MLLKNICVLTLAALIFPIVASAQQTAVASNHLLFNVPPDTPPQTGFLNLGGRSIDGHELEVNSQYLIRDGKPWLPVMGEMHFSRVPQAEWADEIAKMKAGGVDIVSTYIFWNHHEEIEGEFDFTGQRDLREFLKVCAQQHMLVFLRIGPWAHGEARNGGFPDWLLKEAPKTRVNDPVYLKYVARYFDQLGEQTKGLLWKDGGPVVGVQFENEYPLTGPGAGVEHIAELKRLALQSGLTVPLYTVTAWPAFHFPPKEEIPMYGGYPDGFWISSLKDSPPKDVYLFHAHRYIGDMGAMAKSTNSAAAIDPGNYPFGAAEAGAGMETAYHRRPLILPEDITSLTIAGLGSGLNIYGYFMFHGGANPPGKLTSLQESQQSGYPNDLPTVSYDFQAPIGEFGQERKSYFELKELNLFLNAFGDQLAQMQSSEPTRQPNNAADTTVPRAAVRSKDGRGFLFVNNYIRQTEMPARPNFQAAIHLASGDVSVPAKPVSVPADTAFIWPFNLQLGDATLTYSTAQLLSEAVSPSLTTYFFFAIPGIAPEFAFDPATTASAIYRRGLSGKAIAGGLHLTVTPGRDSLIDVTAKSGQHARIILLTEAEAEACWSISVQGTNHLLLSAANVFVEDNQIHLRSTDPKQLRLAIFQDDLSGWRFAPNEATSHKAGLWTDISAHVLPVTLDYHWQKLNDSGMPPPVKMGTARSGGPSSQVAQIPTEQQFTKAAAAWRFEFPNQNLRHISQIYLKLNYTGDMSKATIGTQLVDDNFFNGAPWEIGLERFLPLLQQNAMTIRILPFGDNPPIYVDPRVWTKLYSHGKIAEVNGVSLLPEYESIFAPAALSK